MTSDSSRGVAERPAGAAWTKVWPDGAVSPQIHWLWFELLEKVNPYRFVEVVQQCNGEEDLVIIRQRVIRIYFWSSTT